VTATRLLVSLPGGDLREALGEVPDEVEFIEWTMQEPAPVSSIDIVVPPQTGGTKLLFQLGNVRTRLVQSQSCRDPLNPSIAIQCVLSRLICLRSVAADL
jgi:hypothetical protein